MGAIRATTTPASGRAAGSADALLRRARDRAFAPPVNQPPRVSIGLPVYNGERYLQSAIECLLRQTFADFELIICDNASTDRTQSICTAFAARDSRVRYFRNERNLGAAGNFNRAFALARGEYFKWAAHDDQHEPQYLARCVAALDADPSAVLCQTATRVVDGAGREVPVIPGVRPIGPEAKSDWYHSDIYDPPRRLDEPRVSERFRELLCGTKWCFEVFGVMRADALRTTPLHLSFYGSDKVLLAAMALRGKFLEVPEPMFLRRFHPGQSSNKGGREQAKFMSSASRGDHVPPQLRCLQWYVRLVARSGLTLRERLGCLAATARWCVWLVRLIVRQRNERGALHRIVSRLIGG